VNSSRRRRRRLRSTAIREKVPGVSPHGASACGGLVAAVLMASCGGGHDDACTSDDYRCNSGTVSVDASIAVVHMPPVSCPGVSSFSINPAEVQLGQPASLAVATIGPTATIEWSVIPAAGGRFSDPHSASSVFQCAGPGLVTVTVQVGVPGTAACKGVANTSLSGTINCEAGGIVCFAPNEVCGNACVRIEVDPNNCGGCGTVCQRGHRCLDGNCMRRSYWPWMAE
jgi:hypothetical protein